MAFDKLVFKNLLKNFVYCPLAASINNISYLPVKSIFNASPKTSVILFSSLHFLIFLFVYNARYNLYIFKCYI